MSNGLLADLPRMVSVDIESAGPNPADYALLSIGACTLLEPRARFYVELQPDKASTDAQAMQVHGLDMRVLEKHGLLPAPALQRLEYWLAETISDPRGALFVGFNAAFDWMFLNDTACTTGEQSVRSQRHRHQILRNGPQAERLGRDAHGAAEQQTPAAQRP